ncbi:hypothetical protein [Thiothrix nivea]|uniref:YtxH domain-containing protein n=1 Tax=Thiothrix nivea (strain ATCC 35100 / DSM 5205 / JP2) TaxID=870187 RepID=A0A656HEE3_THINJ|nr:hypothetical protein [Thiothrix nivea]EIJ33569.1 hypothetical protein Thini_0944 [Thiothrix nivea DSM 5205]
MDHHNPMYPPQPQGQAQTPDAMQQPAQGMGQQQAYAMQQPMPQAYPQPPVAYGYPAYAPHYQQQAIPAPAPQASFLNERFVKGLLIGAAAAYILTNENVQRTAIKGAVKAWSLLQGGVEELKERFQDAEAEIRAEAGNE